MFFDCMIVDLEFYGSAYRENTGNGISFVVHTRLSSLTEVNFRIIARIFRDQQQVVSREIHPCVFQARDGITQRSEEHTSELQSLMRISYAVFCLKKKK